MRLTFHCNRQSVSVEIVPAGASYEISIDGRKYRAEAHPLPDGSLALNVDGRALRIDVARLGAERFVGVAGEVYHFVPDSGAPTSSVAALASPEVAAPMPGKVTQVLVSPGDAVAAGDTLLILEAMKMETRLSAEAEGIVREVRVRAGEMVEGGQVLVVLEYGTADADEPAS